MSADVLVVGGGPNGMACAALLAAGGRRVLLLERRRILGGLAAAEEFHPGYRAPGPLHEAALRPDVVAALRLERHGLEPRAEPALLLAEEGGRGLLLARDPGEAHEEIAARRPEDAAAYRALRAFLARVGRPLERLLVGAASADGPVRLARTLWAFRRLGRSDFLELLRTVPMSLADALAERFEEDLLRAGLAAPALAGSLLGPRSPGTAASFLLREAPERAAPPRGGAPAVVRALEAAARARGVEVRTGAAVERIRVREGRAVGVRLAGGEEIDAGVVVAACDPKTALGRLLDAAARGPRLAWRIDRFRAAGTTAKVNLALGAALRFAGRPGLAAERALVTGGMEGLERAFDAAKYRGFTPSLALDVVVPTVEDPSGAPPGHHVVSILAHWVPRELEGGWDAAARERLGEAVLDRLEAVAPGVREHLLACEVLAPPDLEERYGTHGGHLLHGDHALDQLLVRPLPGWGRHAGPVEGLFLASGGTFPGGGLTLAPGALAAAAVERARARRRKAPAG